MNRRSFLTAAAASIFVPQFGRFFREGTGSLWTVQRDILPAEAYTTATELLARSSGGIRLNEAWVRELNESLKQYYRTVYREAYLAERPLAAQFTGQSFPWGSA